MSDIIVVGSINIDFVINTPRVPTAGETLAGDSFDLIPGGKGANQAVAASRLGGNTIMIGSIGNDSFGKLALDSLSGSGVQIENIKVIDETPTGTACIMVEENGENRIVIIAGANGQVKIENETDETLIKNLLSNAKILLLQFEIPLETNLKLIKLANNLNTQVILNPAPALKIEDKYLRMIDYLVLNETEAELFSGIKVTDVESAKQAIAKLLENNAKTIIITLGSQGAILGNIKETIYIPGEKVNVIDTTAAGDTFVGAFSAAILENKSSKDALTYAVNASALAVTVKGAQPSIPTKEQVRSYMNKNNG